MEGGGGVVGGDLHVGVPQAVVGSTNSVSSKGSNKETEPPANKVGSITLFTQLTEVLVSYYTY